MNRISVLPLVVMSIIMTNYTLCAQRSAKTINDQWEFHKPGAKPEAVNLPHTFSTDAYSGMQYYRGPVDYRRALRIDSIDPSKRYFIKFDAASKKADVNFNGNDLGIHKGGYSAFTYDVTSYIKENNIISLTVDNNAPEVTPISADFTFWGGIYRDAWLITTPAIHFNMTNHGSDGIFISTPEVCTDKAIVSVISEVTNDSDKTTSVLIKNVIYSPEGEELQSFTKKVKVAPGEVFPVESLSKPILNPELWSPDSPNLYRVETSIVDSKTGKTLESLNHKTAFRWWNFDGEKGFSLNGKPLKLRGVNRHQDQWPVGVALNDEAHRRDISLMKDMGCNIIRIAHYPQDDAILNACDELGLLVWEEIPIVNIVPDTPEYNDNCETNLVEMIRQHYNHPSVIAWGYMNEILLTAPGPGHPDCEKVRKRTVELANRLEKKLKEEDPARTSVMAFNMTNAYNEIGLDLENVAGWNLYHGWYVGQLGDFEKFCEDQHQRYPSHPIIISEWGAGSDRRIHSVNPRAFDFSIEYQQKYIEHYLPFIEATDWIAGCAYWNFIDFNVAARQESMPRVNNKGLFYNDRTPKDVAYYFKAMWRDDVPVVRIASRDWQKRTGSANQIQKIKIYANTPEVELFCNGESLGSKKVENYFAEFNVELPEGESIISANGRNSSRYAQDAMTIEYSLEPNANEELAINVGSNSSFTSDVSNLTWLADRLYEPSKWGKLNGVEKSTTSEIVKTQDGPLYQTWIEGNVEYQIDAPKGEYEVELLMADVSRPAKQLANLLDMAGNEKDKEAARFDILSLSMDMWLNRIIHLPTVVDIAQHPANGIS